MTEPTEDDNYLISGDVDDSMVPDDTDDSMTGADEDQTNETQLIKEIRKYLKENIAAHNTFDVLSLPQNATREEKCAVFDEMFNHKGVVHHLRQIEQIINNKVKEN